MGKKEEYLKKFTAQLGEWGGKIEEFKQKADKALAETKSELSRHVKDLENKKEAVSIRIKEIKEAGSGAWEHLKEGLEKAADDFKHALSSVRERFKQK
jgi:predicted nuclease with TOPRIM domain